MDSAVEIPGIRNITISGRIGSGTTTLAKNLAKKLNWKLLEGGTLFERFHNDLELHEKDVDQRPDSLDLEYEKMIKKILKEKSHHIIQSHLAGFDAQNISGIFKILVECVDHKGENRLDIRIDRLTNRKGIPVEEAKQEIVARELGNLKKWRKLYAGSDENWAYWDPKYYDLAVNTFDHNPEESLKIVLKAIGFSH